MRRAYTQEDWSPSFKGLFLYYPTHRHVPVALGALIDMIPATGSSNSAARLARILSRRAERGHQLGRCRRLCARRTTRTVRFGSIALIDRRNSNGRNRRRAVECNAVEESPLSSMKPSFRDQIVIRSISSRVIASLVRS
jgi:hypothetical protein